MADPKKSYPGTTLRGFRIEDSWWEEALEIAESRDENLSEHVLRPAVEAYVRKHRRK